MDLFDAIISSLHDVMAPSALLLMGLGVVIGLVVGLLPGLGGPVALAVMLPFTFGMTTVEAFAFLIGAISVITIGGDVTAILYGIPGEPGAAALIMDGHPLAKKGQAGRAIGAMIGSSTVGALFGAVVLVALIPLVRPLLLLFGAPEYLMVAVLGLTFIAGLSGKSIRNGIIVTCIGLFLGTVGMQPQSGTPRYTFGQLHLWDGISLVAVAAGLFAIPELLDALRRGTIAQATSASRGFLSGVMESLRKVMLTFRCNVIGVVAGLIPGVGGVIAQWIAYGHGRQTTKDSTEFGTGAIDGVIAPSAAQNSKEGSNLVALAAFGIPTSVTMALLLGGLTIKGLVPGEQMLTTHVDLTVSFVWTMIIAHFLGIFLLVFSIKFLTKITRMRAVIILPPLVMLVYVGAFAEKASSFDMWVMLAFGMFGVLLERIEWPRPPLVLGLVLGVLMERNLNISNDRYGYDWLERPGVIAMAVLAAAALLVPLVIKKVKGKQSLGPTVAVEEASQAPATAQDRVRSVRTTLVTALVIVFGSIAAILAALDWTWRDKLFPVILAGLLIVLAGHAAVVSWRSLARAGQLWMGLRLDGPPRVELPMGGDVSQVDISALGGDQVQAAGGAVRVIKSALDAAPVDAEMPSSVPRRLSAIAKDWGLFVGVGVLITVLGFEIGGLVASFSYLLVAMRERLRVAIVVTAVCWIIVLLVAIFGQVPLYRGLLSLGIFL